MENLLEGGIAQLEEIKSAISDLSKKEQEYKESDRSLKAKQKEYDIQKKRVEEKITASVKKARAELEKGFDDQVSSAERAIKEAETHKKNAKTAAVSRRMKEENSFLVDENKTLEAEIKARFKEAKVPLICRSPLYYSLFKPSKKIDYLICAIAVLIFAGVIPFVVTRFVSGTFLRVLIWVLIALFFAAIYFVIYSWTRKGEKDLELTNMRSNIERIADNRKAIKKRNKNIKADPDESQYNLHEFDAQVDEAKAEYESAMTQKEEAIRNFEEVESVRIRDEVMAEKEAVFSQMEKEIDQMQDDLLIRTENYQAAAKTMEEYTECLGEKTVKADKIDELINIINEGKAVTIQDALELQKGK